MGRKPATEKKKGGGETEKMSEDKLVLMEVSKALEIEIGLLQKRMELEPTEDIIEKKVRMVLAILRMNISALRGTMKDSMKDGSSVTKERKEAIDRLVKVTNDFDEKRHTAESFDEEARQALNSLSDAFNVFGSSWNSIRDSIVQLSMDHIQGIEGRDPLHKEKAELERWTKHNKMEEKKEEEKKAREKAEKEKEKKKNKKKNKKSATASTDDDFGDHRVPLQGNITCCCRHDHYAEEVDDLPVSLVEVDSVECGSSVASELEFHDLASVSSSTSTSTDVSIYDEPSVARIMSDDQWIQFCEIYKR